MPRLDPYKNFSFVVEVEGREVAGISRVTGLKGSTEVLEYREGGDRKSATKLPGRETFDVVTLERGLTRDDFFVKWRKAVKDGDPDYKKDMVIYLKNRAGDKVKQWNLYGCWPSSLATGDLEALGNDVLIETAEIQVDDMDDPINL
jgi:phage tail-like protein